MKRGLVLAGLVGLGVVASLATESRARQNVAEIARVKDNLYVITGGGGNTAAFITANGVVVVDTKLAGWGQAILDQIRSVTDKPVTTIINTHTHGDHVGSNAEFAPSVDIVAHANTKANMQKMDAFKGDSAAFLPKRTYTDRLSLGDGPDRVDLYYFGVGHTSGDLIIVFPALATAHTGDLFPGPQAPLLDTNNGGSGVAYPETIGRMVSGLSGVSTIIPGHSAVTTWQALVDFRDFNAEFVAAVRAAKQAGKTVEQAAAELQLSPKFRDYNMRRAAANVGVIYEELRE